MLGLKHKGWIYLPYLGSNWGLPASCRNATSHMSRMLLDGKTADISIDIQHESYLMTSSERQANATSDDDSIDCLLLTSQLLLCSIRLCWEAGALEAGLRFSDGQ